MAIRLSWQKTPTKSLVNDWFQVAVAATIGASTYKQQSIIFIKTINLTYGLL
jgi:hypothetical protein